jgi:hypothetical protein
VAAVEKKGRNKIGRIRLQVVPDCSGDTLEHFVSTNIDSGSHVVTDGWKGYDVIDPIIYEHQQVIASRSADKDSVLPGVHMVASLVKRMRVSTLRVVENVQGRTADTIPTLGRKKVFYK